MVAWDITCVCGTMQIPPDARAERSDRSIAAKFGQGGSVTQTRIRFLSMLMVASSFALTPPFLLRRRHA